jgi:hypothetical protein
MPECLVTQSDGDGDDFAGGWSEVSGGEVGFGRW